MQSCFIFSLKAFLLFETFLSMGMDFTAYEIARDKEIKRTFDRMIADELQIDNYLDFWK